jgi:hypothetical protein
MPVSAWAAPATATAAIKVIAKRVIMGFLGSCLVGGRAAARCGSGVLQRLFQSQLQKLKLAALFENRRGSEHIAPPNSMTPTASSGARRPGASAAPCGGRLGREQIKNDAHGVIGSKATRRGRRPAGARFARVKPIKCREGRRSDEPAWSLHGRWAPFTKSHGSRQRQHPSGSYRPPGHIAPNAPRSPPNVSCCGGISKAVR